jgi:FdrA protein
MTDAPQEEAFKRSWREVPDSVRLALISTPGLYAAAEAWKALRAGRHVFLFSDNVPVADEVALKKAGRSRDLLVMGPECGTAIISGVPLGFANAVRRGNIGLVAASGTGLQEVTCLIDRFGGGISHAIGTGGRDLSRAVGGLTMEHGIDLLLEDPGTDVLVLISKPPDPEIADRLVAGVRRAQKHVVVCFLGQERVPGESDQLSFARTLEETAEIALERAGIGLALEERRGQRPPPAWEKPPFLRGLFSGGTLAYEAMLILEREVGPIWSNASLDPEYEILGKTMPEGHVCLDLGAEQYTQGRPHPMIDGTLRAEHIRQAAQDPVVGVILLDFVLGFGSAPDPAGALIPAITEAQATAEEDGRMLRIVASVVGTLRDPQSREDQVSRLEKAGVDVAQTNAAAARHASQLILSKTA